MFCEILGSMILIFLYLTQTEKKYELTEDSALKMMIVSAGYVFGIIIATDAPEKIYFSPRNPAIAAAIEFSYLTTIGDKAFQANWAYVQCTFPYIGALLAVVLYEFGYKRSVDIIEEVNMDDDDDMEVDKTRLLEAVNDSHL